MDPRKLNCFFLSTSSWIVDIKYPKDHWTLKTGYLRTLPLLYRFKPFHCRSKILRVNVTNYMPDMDPVGWFIPVRHRALKRHQDRPLSPWWWSWNCVNIQSTEPTLFFGFGWVLPWWCPDTQDMVVYLHLVDFCTGKCMEIGHTRHVNLFISQSAGQPGRVGDWGFHAWRQCEQVWSPNHQEFQVPKMKESENLWIRCMDIRLMDTGNPGPRKTAKKKGTVYTSILGTWNSWSPKECLSRVENGE